MMMDKSMMGSMGAPSSMPGMPAMMPAAAQMCMVPRWR